MGCPVMVVGSKPPKSASLLVKLEVLIYTSAFVGSLGYLIYAASMYSEHLNYGGLLFGSLQKQNGLHAGWIFRNRMVDVNSDGWRRFNYVTRIGGPFLYLGAAVLKIQVRKRFPQHEAKVLALYYLLFATYIHRGAKVLVLIVYALLNFYMSKLVAGRKYGPMAIWSYNFLWLSFSKSKDFRKWMKRRSTAPIWGMGEVNLKLPFLYMFMKCISYGMDLHWARIKRPSVYKELDEDTESGAYKARIDRHLPHEYYNSTLSYIQYIFYPPLYIDGPTITFNDFVSQVKGFSVRKHRVLWYGIRAVTMIVMLEVYYHFVYADSIVAFKFYIPLKTGISNYHNPDESPTFGNLGFLCLIICSFLSFYLSYLVIWTIARFWALVDGVECPADFTKCIARCSNMQELWKHWHASLTKWCTRYIYIPLGGSTGSTLSTCINMAVVFGYSALWHNYDSTFALWGVLTSVFIAAELVVRWSAKPGEEQISPKMSRRQTVDRVQPPRSEGLHRLMPLVPAVSMFGFIFINMATFTFGQKQVYNILASFAGDPLIIIWITLMLYSNRRLVTIHNSWIDNGGPKSKLHSFNQDTKLT